MVSFKRTTGRSAPSDGWTEAQKPVHKGVDGKSASPHDGSSFSSCQIILHSLRMAHGHVQLFCQTGRRCIKVISCINREEEPSHYFRQEDTLRYAMPNCQGNVIFPLGRSGGLNLRGKVKHKSVSGKPCLPADAPSRDRLAYFNLHIRPSSYCDNARK